MSVNSSYTSFGEAAAVPCMNSMPMTALTTKRIKTFYNKNPSEIINIKADDKFHENGAMQYKKIFNSNQLPKSLRNNPKPIIKTLTDFELKTMLEMYKGKNDFYDNTKEYIESRYNESDNSIKTKRNTKLNSGSLIYSKQILTEREKKDAILFKIIDEANCIEHNGLTSDYYIKELQKKQNATSKILNRLSRNLSKRLLLVKNHLTADKKKSMNMDLLRNTQKHHQTLQIIKRPSRKKTCESKESMDHVRKIIELKETLLKQLNEKNKECNDYMKKIKDQMVEPISKRNSQRITLKFGHKTVNDIKTKPTKNKKVICLNNHYEEIIPRYIDISLTINTITKPIPKDYPIISTKVPMTCSSQTHSKKTIEQNLKTTIKSKKFNSSINHEYSSNKKVKKSNSAFTEVIGFGISL